MDNNEHFRRSDVSEGKPGDMIFQTVDLQKKLIATISAENERLLEALGEAKTLMQDMSKRNKTILENRDYVLHLNQANFQQYNYSIKNMSFLKDVYKIIAGLEFLIIILLLSKLAGD